MIYYIGSIDIEMEGCFFFVFHFKEIFNNGCSKKLFWYELCETDRQKSFSSQNTEEVCRNLRRIDFNRTYTNKHRNTLTQTHTSFLMKASSVAMKTELKCRFIAQILYWNANTRGFLALATVSRANVSNFALLSVFVFKLY